MSVAVQATVSDCFSSSLLHTVLALSDSTQQSCTFLNIVYEKARNGLKGSAFCELKVFMTSQCEGLGFESTGQLRSVCMFSQCRCNSWSPTTLVVFVAFSAWL